MISEKAKRHLKRLSDPNLPKDKILFLDTSFVVAALFTPDLVLIKELEDKKKRSSQEDDELRKLRFHLHRHNESVKFVERLIKEKVNIAFSSILFHEFYFASKYIELDKVYKDRAVTQTELKKDPKIIKDHIGNILKSWQLFMDLLGKFKNRIFAVMPSDTEIIKETMRVRVDHGLNPNDAIHLGTVLAGRKKDIVLFDKKFKDAALVEGLNVWYYVQ